MTTADTLAKKKLDQMAEIIADPVLFTEHMLHHSTWSIPQRILRELAKPRARVSVRSCHASGKSFTAAEACLWGLARFQDIIIATTAPTFSQVQNVLWPEIHKSILGSEIAYPAPNRTELRLEPRRYALGISTNEAVRFQGFHADHCIVIIDEGVGVAPEIWEAIEGIRAGGDVRILALGNPTIASGTFFNTFGAPGWVNIGISAFDTPNLEGVSLERLLEMSEEELEDNERPYLVTRQWVREKYTEWGPGHPLWQSRVLGQFPTQAEDALFSMEWLEAARQREGEVDHDADVYAGVDVSGPGEEETSLCIRQADGHIVEHLSWKKPDPRGEVVAALMPYRGRLRRVNVDSIGIGYYMAKHIEDIIDVGNDGIVHQVNVQEHSDEREKYADLKAEIYWNFRKRLQEGRVSGLADETAIGQLAAIRYEHNSRGQVKLENKMEIRKRGVPSPDRAEAIILSFIEDSSAGVWFA